MSEENAADMRNSDLRKAFGTSAREHLTKEILQTGTIWSLNWMEVGERKGKGNGSWWGLDSSQTSPDPS